MFTHSLTGKDIVLPLYEHGLIHLLFQNVHDLIGPADGDPESLSYQKSSLSGCVCGFLNKWIRRGMTDPPEKMSELFRDIQINDLVQSVIEQETKKQ